MPYYYAILFDSVVHWYTVSCSKTTTEALRSNEICPIFHGKASKICGIGEFINELAFDKLPKQDTQTHLYVLPLQGDYKL